MPVPIYQPPKKKPRITPGMRTALTPPAPKPPPKGVVRPPSAPTQVVPPKPVYGAAPPTTQGQAIRSDADKAMMGADTDYRDSVYRAVMGLGDPTQIDKFQADPNFAGYNFVVDPTSTFSQLGLNEQRGLQDINNASLGGNTFFSGLRLNNRDDLAQDYTFQRAGAVKSFEEALANYARALTTARGARQQAYTQANQTDFDAANAIAPEPAALAPTPKPTPVGPSYKEKAQAYSKAKKKAKKK